MSQKLPLPFDAFLQEPEERETAQRLAALNEPVIKKNETQIVSALSSLLGQLPGHGPALKKTYALAHEQFQKTRHLFLRHALFATHPWLVPYVIAARMASQSIAGEAMHYQMRFHTEALPHLTQEEAEECKKQGLKFSERKHGPKNNEKSLLNPRKQRLSYPDVGGVSQTAVVPSLLMMGYQSRDTFTRATKMGMDSLFIISRDALHALAEVTIEGKEKPAATPLDHLVPVRPLVETKEAAPPSQKTGQNGFRQAQGHAAYRQDQLDGFFKPPRL